MTNHTPAKVDSYEDYAADSSTGFEWECSCGDSSNDYGTFAEAYDDLKQHCDTANEQLIQDTALELYNIATHKKIAGQYDFVSLAEHVLENGYRG